MDVALMSPNMIQETLRKVNLLEYWRLRVCNKGMNYLGNATIHKFRYSCNSPLDIVITYQNASGAVNCNVTVTIKGANRIVVIEDNYLDSFFFDIQNTKFKSIGITEQWIDQLEEYSPDTEQKALAVLKKAFDGIKLNCVKINLNTSNTTALEGIRYLLSLASFEEVELNGEPHHPALWPFDQLIGIKEFKKASKLSLACTPPQSGMYDLFKNYQETTLTCYYGRNTFIDVHRLLNEIRGKDTSQHPMRVLSIDYIHTEVDVRHLENNNLKLIFADPTPAVFRFQPKSDYFYYVTESKTEIILAVYGREDGIHATTISRVFMLKDREEVYLKLVELLSSFRHFYFPNPYDASVVYQEFVDTDWDHMGPVVRKIEFYLRKFKGIDI